MILEMKCLKCSKKNITFNFLSCLFFVNWTFHSFFSLIWFLWEEEFQVLKGEICGEPELTLDYKEPVFGPLDSPSVQNLTLLTQKYLTVKSDWASRLQPWWRTVMENGWLSEFHFEIYLFYFIFHLLCITNIERYIVLKIINSFCLSAVDL